MKPIPVLTGPASLAPGFIYYDQIVGYLNSGYVSDAPNFLDNAEFLVYQRGTTAVTSIANSAKYGPDRWFGYGGASSAGRLENVTSGVPVGFQSSAKLTRASGNSDTGAIYLTQIIPANRVKSLAGGPVSLSLFVKAGANFSAASGAISVSLLSGTTADEGAATLISGWTGVATLVTWAPVITTAYQQLTFDNFATIPTNSAELALRIGFTPVGTASTYDGFEVTGVSLTPGLLARTNYPHKFVAEEMPALLRYYFQMNEPANTVRQGVGECLTNQTAHIQIRPPVPMRALPTSSTVTLGSYAVTKNDGSSQALSTLALVSSSYDAVGGITVLATASATNLAAGDATALLGGGGAGVIAISADL